jgi:hypothetical protein
MVPTTNIDILENSLRKQGDLLDILLIDRTSKKNILWGTDSYIKYGRGFKPKEKINVERVTGSYSHLIQPRASKSIDEQKQRTKDKAEVFTPLRIVDQINKLVDWSGKLSVADHKNWQDYVSQLMLEVSCGEAPFIVSRYNPTSHTGKLIKIENRVGFLDRKLRIVSQYCNTPKEWLKWAKAAYKASYGYEWQGDNLLIARENLLYTLIDYYKEKFGRKPRLSSLREFAEIISWNIFQMDGLKYVIPMSCINRDFVIPVQTTFFGDDKLLRGTVLECNGCSSSNPYRHDGMYAKVMDWDKEEPIRFVDLLEKR